MLRVTLHITCRTLKQVFHELMVGSYSKQLRELRNDLLMICLRIAQLCPDAPFVVSCT